MQDTAGVSERQQKSGAGQSKWRQYRYVIKELTSREIKRKYARSYLGIIWSVLNPLLQMAVVTLVFSTVFQRNVENYPLFYLTGVAVWNLFTQGTNSTLSCLVDNKGMMFRTLLPKQIFITSRVYTALTNFGFSFIALMGIALITQRRIPWTIVFWIYDLLTLVLFVMGVGYVLSILYVFFADVKYLYNVFTRLLFWLSAIFYPIERLNPIAQQLVRANPMYAFIRFGRICTMDGVVPERMLWIQITLWSLSAFCFGYLTFRRHENEVMARL